MEFGTWYLINCGSEKEWACDFAMVKKSGFDFVVLWDMVSPPVGAEVGGDCRVTRHPAKVLRALRAAGNAGLQVYFGIWHPYNMGNIPLKYRIHLSNGKTINGPNIFNLEWLHKTWVPYVKAVARAFKDQPAYRGVYFDDSFPSVRSNGITYLNYSPADRRRFREWMKQRYLTIANLNSRYKLQRSAELYRSFASVEPPKSPADGLVLWNDWMEARAEWCEDFARLAKEAYRSVDKNPRHLLVLSEQDYHMDCNSPQYGVDYPRLMKHFDRFEIYQAHDFRKLDQRTMLANARRTVRQGLEITAGKPFQFHTWFVDPVVYSSMKPETLAAVIKAAARAGAKAVEIYSFKMVDWRLPRKQILVPEVPAFKEMSLKYNPGILATIKKLKKALS